MKKHTYIHTGEGNSTFTFKKNIFKIKIVNLNFKCISSVSIGHTAQAKAFSKL